MRKTGGREQTVDSSSSMSGKETPGQEANLVCECVCFGVCEVVHPVSGQTVVNERDMAEGGEGAKEKEAGKQDKKRRTGLGLQSERRRQSA